MSMEVLSKADKLAELEERIYRGFGAFYDAGQALQEIQEEKLYKETGHKTFDDYCQVRWGIKRSRVYQLIDASKVYKNLSTTVDILPTSERQVRPLVQLEPEEQAILWQKTVEQAGGQPTGKQVERTASDFRPAPKPGKMPPKPKPAQTSSPNLSGSFDQGPGIDTEFRQEGQTEMTREQAEEALGKYDDGHRCPYCGRGY